MVGITLSAEQVRSAPPEVRRWLEHQLAISLGLRAEPEEAAERSGRLAALDIAQAAEVLSLIENILPAANVFFELGRAGESAGQGDVEAYRLVDLMRHARLQTAEQLLACLQIINDAARRAEVEGELCLLDRRGYCIVAAETQRSILKLWQQIVAGHERAEPSDADAAQAATRPASGSPLHLSGAIPPSALHLSTTD